jgi:DNA-binding MarR family transcriptional regulator
MASTATRAPEPRAEATLEELVPGRDLESLRLVLALERTATRMERALTAGVERHKVSPVAVRTLISIRLLEGGPLNLQELAREVRVTKANVSGELARLEYEGLIRRRSDPDDGRRIRADLTALGHRRLHRWISLGRKAIDEAFGGLGPRERQRLGELAGRMAGAEDSPALATERLRRVEDLFPSIDLSPLRPSMALGRAAASIGAEVEKDIAGSGLSPIALQALITVLLFAGRPLDLGAIVPQLGVNRGSVSRILGELEDMGLITRQPDQNDGRRIRAELTSEGRRVAQRLVPVLHRSCERAAASLAPAERQELGRLLARLEPS